MAGKYYKGSENAYDALKSVDFLKKCGYMTPEAVLGLKNGREYTAEEFYIMGSIGQDLGMDYLGVKQLAPSFSKLQSDYTKLKKLNKNWVMKAQGGTWYKITLPKDPNKPTKNLMDLYICDQEDNESRRIIMTTKDGTRGTEYRYSGGAWGEQYYAQVPVETPTTASAASVETRATMSAVATLPTPELVHVVAVSLDNFYEFALDKLKDDFGIDYKNLTKAEKASIDRAWRDSIDQNITFGLMHYFSWKLFPPDDDDYYYWRTKNLCDVIFAIQYAYSTAVTIDAVIAMLTASGASGGLTLISGGTAAPAFVGSVAGAGVCFAGATLSAIQYGNSIENVKYSSNKLQGLLDAFNLKRLEIASKIEVMMQPAVRIIKQKYPTAKVGYRGSLATNTRAKGKGPFDPNDFDVDAFIVSDELAALFKKNAKWRNAADIPSLGIKNLCKEIEDMVKVTFPGYRVDPAKPFAFKVWTEAEYLKTVKPNGFVLIE